MMSSSTSYRAFVYVSLTLVFRVDLMDAYCDQYYYKQCKNGACVQRDDYCDEEVCPYYRPYRCHSVYQCYSDADICDGRPACDDWSDEMGCQPVAAKPTLPPDPDAWLIPAVGWVGGIFGVILITLFIYLQCRAKRHIPAMPIPRSRPPSYNSYLMYLPGNGPLAVVGPPEYHQVVQGGQGLPSDNPPAYHFTISGRTIPTGLELNPNQFENIVTGLELNSDNLGRLSHGESRRNTLQMNEGTMVNGHREGQTDGSENTSVEESNVQRKSGGSDQSTFSLGANEYQANTH